MLRNFIDDPYFRVELDLDGTSPNPEVAIWRGQHQCVCEGFSPDDPLPAKPGEAIVHHQMKVEHYSVLNKAFFSFHIGGFPHSTVMQFVRHQDSHHLVQSGRYTGKRFIPASAEETPVEGQTILDVVESKLSLEEVFYLRPEGYYTDRGSSKYYYSEDERKADLKRCKDSAIVYADKVRRGWSEEHARDFVLHNFRQNFNLSGTLEAIFHLLDQRTKADSQIEAQTLAELIMRRVEERAPVLGAWYRKERYGKARLAP